MFTFSHEFLELFDRRLADLLELNGRDFVVAARAWLAWLETDQRTRLAWDELLGDGEAARERLAKAVDAVLDDYVGLRERLEATDVALEDPPEPVEPGPNTPGDAAGLFIERFSFRYFDRLVRHLRSTKPQKLSAWESVSDPLEELRAVLQAKRSSYIHDPILDASVQDGYRLMRADEQRQRLDALSGWRFAEVDGAYRREIEQLGMDFLASPARAARMLIEILRTALTLTSDKEESWFRTGLFAPGGPPRPLTSELSEAILTTIHRDAETAKRLRVGSQNL